MRKTSKVVQGREMAAFIAIFAGLSVIAGGQEVGKTQSPPPSDGAVGIRANDESIDAIDEDYARQVLVLERRRLERLDRLASRQNPSEAAATYEKLFRLAMAANLFGEAEKPAAKVIEAGSPSRVTLGLAHAIKIVAEIDRGDYEASLESLRKAAADREKAVRGGSPGPELPTDELVDLCDAFNQRLMLSGRYDIARRAFTSLLEQTRRPVLREFLSGRLKRLEVIGKPAPAIRGTDLSGKPFDLAEFRGKRSVLVVFWASWCLPCEAEVEWLHDLEKTHGAGGLQILGINLDATSAGDSKEGSVLPNVRRFLLDHNVNWPTLMNGEAEKDYAGAYNVTEIPANVLVGRDGTIRSIDLVRKNAGSTIARVIGQ